MQSKATTVEQYLKELPEDRRSAIQAVRKVILENLDDQYAEGMQYGMIGYFVPHSIYPAGYHCDPKQPLPFGGLASQKNHMSVYLMSVYGEGESSFRKAWAKTGKKLDMGKCCVRFRKIEDLALDVIGEAVRLVPVEKYIEHYEKARATASSGRSRPSGAAGKSAAAKTTRKAKTNSAKGGAAAGKSAKKKAAR